MSGRTSEEKIRQVEAEKCTCSTPDFDSIETLNLEKVAGEAMNKVSFLMLLILIIWNNVNTLICLYYIMKLSKIGGV